MMVEVSSSVVNFLNRPYIFYLQVASVKCLVLSQSIEAQTTVPNILNNYNAYVIYSITLLISN